MQDSQTPRAFRAILIVSALGAALSASAASITQNFNVALARTSFTSIKSLDKFDSNLGTLTSIEFFLEGTIRTTISLSNLSSSSVNTITGTVFGDFSIKAGPTASLTTFLTGTASVMKSGTYAVNPTGDVDYTNGRGQIFAVDSVTGSFNSSSSLLPDLALVTGAMGDKMDFRIRTGSRDFSTATAGNEFMTSDTFGSANGYVRYNYVQAVPEPATAVVLGINALAIMRRRKKAVSK